jgi:hypothetical protein
MQSNGVDVNVPCSQQVAIQFFDDPVVTFLERLIVLSVLLGFSRH